MSHSHQGPTISVQLRFSFLHSRLTFGPVFKFRRRFRRRIYHFLTRVFERGMAGTDPSTRGRSPVVLEVRFRSRAFSKAEIQSEIVLGYLHYLGFCTV